MIRKYKQAALHDFILETAFENENYKVKKYNQIYEWMFSTESHLVSDVQS